MAGPSFGILSKFFQKAGFFPCKKVVENDKTYLEPIKGCIQISKLFFCWISILFLDVASYWIPYSSSLNYDNFLDFVVDIYMTGFSLKGSTFDIAVNICLYPFLLGFHFMNLWKSFRVRKKMCDIFNYLEHHRIFEVKISEKEYILHIVKIAILVIGQGFFAIGSVLNIEENFSFGFIPLVPYFLCYFILVPILHAPLMALHIYFLEIHWKLQSWMNSLKKGLENNESFGIHLDQCNHLAKRERMVFQQVGQAQYGPLVGHMGLAGRLRRLSANMGQGACSCAGG